MIIYIYIALWLVLLAYLILEADFMDSSQWPNISLVGMVLRILVGIYTLGFLFYLAMSWATGRS